MDVTISVDEEMFKEVLEKELAALPKEKIQEILVKGIEEKFSKSNYSLLDDLLIQKSSSYYDNSRFPSAFAEQLIKTTDCSKLQELVDKCAEALSTRYRDILIEILSNALMDGLSNSAAFNDKLKTIVNMELTKVLNNNQY